MIQTLQITPEVLTSNTDNINFDTIDVRSRSANCCGWLQYMPGGSDFTIIGGGTFKVSFNANVTSDTAGTVALALKSATGTDIEGTEMDATIATAGEYTNWHYALSKAATQEKFTAPMADAASTIVDYFKKKGTI